MRGAITLFVFMASAVIAEAETADTIFINGNIYTVNEKQPHAGAIAVKDDRIIFVGASAEAEKLRGDKTRIVDLAGKTVTPGFTDSHCHIFEIGEREIPAKIFWRRSGSASRKHVARASSLRGKQASRLFPLRRQARCLPAPQPRRPHHGRNG